MVEFYDRTKETRTFSEIWFKQKIDIIDSLVDMDYKILSPVKGAAAEYRWAEDILKKSIFISHFQKLNDKKCPDYVVRYLNYSGLVICEVKCIASGTIKFKNGFLEAKVNISHRDNREVEFPCGGTASLLNIHKGEYDLLAINIFDLIGSHKWVYINAEDLEVEIKFPKSKCYASLTQEQKDSGFLLKNHQTVTWPLSSPWTENLQDVLNSVIISKMEAAA